MAKRRKFALVDGKSPKRKHVQPDGTFRTEKLNPIPYQRKVVDPDGNIVAVSLAPGRNFPIGVDQDNPYGVAIKLRKSPPEFLPFDECPLRKGYLPPAPGDRGCDGDDGQGAFYEGRPDGANGFRTGHSAREACPHLKAVIASRRAGKRKHNDAVNRRFEQNQDKVVKELRAATEALGAKVGEQRGKQNAAIRKGAEADG